MKKCLSAVLALTLVLALSACVSNKPKDSSSSPASSAAASIAEGDLKTGFAVVSEISSSKDAGTDPGLAQIDSTAAALTVDSQGKIASCMIDAVQAKVNFTTAGKITTDLAAGVKTKNELGTAYGMKKSSGIGKEWNEQAAAFAAYVTGKTLDEVKGIAVNAEGYSTDADLKASVTIHISGLIGVVEKAYNSAASLGAKAGDKLGLGIVTDLSDSAGAGSDPGLAQAYSTYAAVTFDAQGKITSSVIDAYQGKVNFSKAGKLTTDLKTAQKTKNELGDAYGMKKNSGIGKEWNEQAAAFSDYIKGKTVADVKGIAVDAETHPTKEDLKATVTVSVGGFKTVVEKASANAK